MAETSEGRSPDIGKTRPEKPSMKRLMLQSALRKAGVTRATFPGWYQDILGKPFVKLEEADVKPLWDAAYRAVEERRQDASRRVQVALSRVEPPGTKDSIPAAPSPASGGTQ